MEKKIKEPQKGILTDQMDVNSDEFHEFQSIILEESKKRSAKDLHNIELTALRFEMEDYLKSSTTDIQVKRAGQFLKQILKTLKIKQNVFASYIGMKPSNLSKLLNGDRPINNEMALLLGKLFSHDPMLWIKIQAKNDLHNITQSKSQQFEDFSLEELISMQKKAG
ncbi:addiction module antidote protein, HigA family [Puteibacter caeruleilacunae]|nr:addiction module antidote protein, HigA family [Puteibacter caeruleilacunae]